MTNSNSTPNRFTYARLTPSGWDHSEPIFLSTRMILEEADRLGIQWKVLPGTRIFELSWQGQTQYFRNQIPSTTTDIGFYATDDKSVTRNLLEAQGLAVPKGFNIRRDDPVSYWREIFDNLTKPLVIKPTHANKGDGISIGIHSWPEFEAAVTKALAFVNLKNTGAVVEEFFGGSEYRILATRDKVVGIIQRVPANVIGDGLHTISQLIDTKNDSPTRGTDDTVPSAIILKDEDVQANLTAQGLTLETILPANQQVFLRKVSNLSKGGDAIDVTDQAHPSVATLALQAMQAIPGLGWGGVDFMTTDLTQPQTPDTYRIIEVNSSPGFSNQELPDVGTPRNGKRAFLELLFPDLAHVQ